ncbi:MAG: YdcF family protein [Nitrosospira sp.]|nr:YdcF family protein [Nitrosospira sp.]MBI0412881.1 YdcF family protein [Nitrosospira sp.]MSQ44611.1 YdcF family protein [Nitrosomonadaceae bacterium]
MSWTATNLVSAFLLPPLNLILLGALGVLLLKHHPRLGRFLLASTLALLYLISTPFIVETMLQKFETPYVADSVDSEGQVIVVLGGGTYFNAVEYGGDTVNRYSLERIRYAAHLYQLTGKLILVTGGAPLGNATSEAEQMKSVLENEFMTPVKWVEGTSNNTHENAYKSYEILKKDGITHIMLVTHAWHMPRAVKEFERAGFQVTPAPTAFTTRYRTDGLAYLPTASALQQSRIFIHEVIGMLWYRLLPAPNKI